MNREIKFRGVNNSGEWIYGSLVMTENIRPAIYFEAGNGTVKEVDWQYVKEESIGQFTGLKDKNVKEIYEGDVVEYNKISNTNIEKGKVIYNNNKAMFVIYTENKRDTELYNDVFGKVKVIGNIFENPDLIN